MENLKIQRAYIINAVKTALVIISLVMMNSLRAQDTKTTDSFATLEAMQDANMNYLKEIYRIIKNYPQFSYEYTMENGEVKDVTVTGVDNTMDKKRLEVVLFDLKNNKNAMKNKKNRIGVFYTVDELAKPIKGDEAMREEIEKNLNYPEDALDWGLDGTIFVKFVVDENGKIPFATASADIKTDQEGYVEELKQSAIDAVKETSGEWIPGEVDGVKVASLAYIPIKFEFEKDPAVPVLIR